MPDDIEYWVFPGGVVTIQNYRAPTCVVDLQPGSAVQRILEGSHSYFVTPDPPLIHTAGALFPSGERAVRFFAMVGKAMDEEGEVPFGDFLSFASVVTAPIGGYVLQHIVEWEETSDIIVPHLSQRGGATLAFHEYLRHGHSEGLPTDYSETASSAMAIHAAYLLSWLPEQIALFQLTDGEGIISYPYNDAEFEPLTNGVVPPCAP